MLFNTKLFFLQSVGKIMKSVGRGSAIVGYLDEKMRLNVLKEIDLSEKEVIFVVGTNGKTTINNTLYKIYKNKGLNVLSNLEGANLVSGIATSIIMDLDKKDLKSDILLLEVDEKNVSLIAKKIKPNNIIVNNFFRDQLDRYFELELILDSLLKVILEHNPNVYINAQDPLINQFFEGYDLNLIKYSLDETPFGDATNVKEIQYCAKCKTKLEYNFFHYSHIGDFYCPKCNFKVDNVNVNFKLANNILYSTEDENIKLEFKKYPPLYLILNLCAILNFTIDKNLLNSEALTILSEASSPKGRNSNFVINNKDVYLTLAKNVVGMEQTINYLLNKYDKIDLLIAFNDNYADSKDVSWIWDVDFKKLAPIISSLKVTGLRKGDMKLRLLYEGFENVEVYDNIEKSIDEILKDENPVIISNYTPLSTINNYLSKLK